MRQKGRAANAATPDRRFENKDVERTQKTANDAADQQPALEAVDAGPSGGARSKVAACRSRESADQGDPEDEGNGDARPVVDGHRCGRSFFGRRLSPKPRAWREGRRLSQTGEFAQLDGRIVLYLFSPPR